MFYSSPACSSKASHKIARPQVKSARVTRTVVVAAVRDDYAYNNILFYSTFHSSRSHSIFSLPSVSAVWMKTPVSVTSVLQELSAICTTQQIVLDVARHHTAKIWKLRTK
ncbi:uncharacterized protein [Periplaneta americana]|uniref:uncharacterized protein isoform X1 n=1 Tax=Periplaneta americana TaxID=6978 RepID=UPI0037E9A52E